MARGRMLSKGISLDEKVDALSNDTARLLFTWMVPHLDVEGRMYGDARLFKSIVAPRRNYSVKRVEKVLIEMEKLGLIKRYSVDGNQYLFAPKFEKHQIGLRKEREQQSQIPPPTPELLQNKSRVNPDKVPPKSKLSLREKKISKEKDTSIINKEAKEIWEKCLEILKEKVNKPNFDTWLKGTVGLLYQGTVFIIGVPREDIGKYLMENQRSGLENVLAQVTKKRLGIGYRITKKGMPNVS